MKNRKKFISVFLMFITTFSLVFSNRMEVKAADKDGLFTMRFYEYDSEIEDYKARPDLTKSVKISKADDETKEYLYKTVTTMYSENCGEAVWDIDGVRYKIKKRNFKKTERKTEKDGKVEVYKEMLDTAENAEEYYDMLTTSPEEGTYPEYFYDPDAMDLPNTEDMKLSTQVKGVVNKLLDSAVTWITSALVDTFDNVAIDVATKFGPNFDYIETIFGNQDGVTIQGAFGEKEVVYYNDFFNNAGKAIKTIGWALLILMWLLCLIFSMFGIVTGYDENPFLIVARLCISAFLVLNAYEVMKVIMGIGESIFNVLVTNASTTAINSQIQMGGIIRTLLTTRSGIGPILGIIFTIMILWNLFKLFLEMMERYIVMIVMYIFSPVPLAMFISKATEKVFYSYLSMFISQLAVFCVNLFMTKIIAAAITMMPTYILTTAGSSVMSQILFYFFVIGLIKGAMKVDNYLADMGLTVAKTSANLAGSAMGVVAIVTSGARAMANMGEKGVVGALGGASSKTVNSTSSNTVNSSPIGGIKTLGEYMKPYTSKREMDNAVSGISKDGVLRSGKTSSSMDGIRKMEKAFQKPVSVRGEALGNTLKEHSNIGKALGISEEHFKSMGLVGSANGGTVDKAKDLEESFLNGNGMGELYMKNKDGTTSHVKLSGREMDGYTDIENGLYAKVDTTNGYAPIGGMRAINDQGNPMDKASLKVLSERTGNFGKTHMQDMGFDTGKYEELGATYLDANSIAITNAADKRIGRIDTNAFEVDGNGNPIENRVDYQGSSFTAFHSPTREEMMNYINAKETPRHLLNAGFENEDYIRQLSKSYEDNWDKKGFCSADTPTGTYAILDSARYKMEKNDLIINLGDNKQAFLRNMRRGNEPGGRT